MASALFALVEIGGDPTLLIVGAVFIITFLAAGAIGYLLFGNRRGDAPTSFNFQLQQRLPVSKQTFERISRVTEAAMAPPPISPATAAKLDHIGQMRRVFVSTYRVLMLVIGLAGLTVGVLLLKSHTPANMNGLPGAIIALCSLGALLNALVPGPSIQPSVEPLDPALLDQFKRKVSVQVNTSQPLRVTLSESDVRLAGEMLGRGVPIADVTRAVYPEYEKLSDLERRSVESVIAQAAARE